MSMYFTWIALIGSLLIILSLLILYKRQPSFFLLISLLSFIVNRTIPYKDIFKNPTSVDYSFSENLFITFYWQDITWFIFALGIFIFILQNKGK